jgi:hypothetical protein
VAPASRPLLLKESMNTKTIGELIRLRYKLLWARTRTRNGRIALFFIGYLLFALVAALLGAGGLGAAMVAVRTGKAELVAQIVLSSLFFQALMATLIMGFGMNAMFSETELRRYPVSALERRVTRHLIAIIDPFWFLVAALEIGLVFGLYALGAGSLGLGLIAVTLLFLVNYLFARVFGLIVERAMQNKAGAAIVMVVVIGSLLSAGQLPALIKRSPWIGEAALRALRYTPPFGAAAAMTRGGAEAAFGLMFLVWWLLGLAAALVALERRPPQRQKAESTAMSFESPFDRAAAWFGSENGPLIAHWWRFYARNSRFRVMTLLSPVFVAFMTYNFGVRNPRGNVFVAALSAFPILTFLGPSRITVNQFGYVGGGFRRYLLLPTDPAAALRTGNFASMLIALPLIPLAIIGWVALAPVPFDPRMVFMLIAASVTGMLVFHGLSLWASLYGARRGNYNQGLGNDLSLVGNLVLIGGIVTFLTTPQILKHVAPAVVAPENWWVGVVPVAAAAGFYMVSLRAATALFRQRHEGLMAVVEGRG